LPEPDTRDVERGRLLDQKNFAAPLGKRDGSAQPANASADDENASHAAHRRLFRAFDRPYFVRSAV
jgi:hypothetical protein